MLLVYLEPFQDSQRELLKAWHQWVHYWPRSSRTNFEYDFTQITDWWLLFHNPMYADIWLMKYSEHSRIIRTLLDE